MKKTKYSKFEERFIKDNYEVLTYREIAQQLTDMGFKRNYSSVASKAMAMGLRKKNVEELRYRKNNIWQQIKQLKFNVGDFVEFDRDVFEFTDDLQNRLVKKRQKAYVVQDCCLCVLVRFKYKGIERKELINKFDVVVGNVKINVLKGVS